MEATSVLKHLWLFKETDTDMLNKKIILCGFMASGKTTVGKALSKKLNIDYVDTDELLVETYGQSISDIFEKDRKSVV